ncbi:major facilitator superfamily transporter [Aaosphaeria arxii CBS 175.79]|uniref:Major facilitator superfamily transporter n=1 Tax=Aaosphaeria arxii CBS 175.79 TaxID=1450172 RepID=A0A6A5XI35_9PLEO|nr:major facilitator superfamily transporter [Aaosphaeria arxii CBS 175.79]KAF2012782.1 major facilitator superfamily transporter [Aaosphaeria arxii CBS 175.79]
MTNSTVDVVSQMEKGAREPKVSSIQNDTTVTSSEGLSESEDPLNWPKSRKWLLTILTSLGGLVTLMSGAMLAPALNFIGKDLSISSAESSMALSIYVLAFAFGPMVLAPCSEVFGRRRVWICGSAWYIVWNTVCGFSNNKGLLITARLFSGLGASVEFAVSGPIVNDMWSDQERGKSMAIRGFLPLLGPALGPIVGGLMVQNLNWRWLFWTLSIFNALIFAVFIVAVPETHHATIVRRGLKTRQGSGEDPSHSSAKTSELSLTSRLKTGIVRPTRFLIFEPTIQIMALIMAYQFGLLYIMLATYSSMWTSHYGLSPSASGLHYLAIVTGYLLAAQIGGWAMDKMWAHLKQKNGGETKPENRLPLMLPGTVLIPAGLLWYGWSVESHLHWIMPDIGVAILGYGLISSSYAAQAYIVDAFLEYNASATAAAMLLRSIFAFVFPIFAPQLYDNLGYGRGNSVLAGLAVILGFPAPILLWKYGERLRG